MDFIVVVDDAAGHWVFPDAFEAFVYEVGRLDGWGSDDGEGFFSSLDWGAAPSLFGWLGWLSPWDDGGAPCWGTGGGVRVGLPQERRP
jgi:hypothetical protein